MRLITKLSKHNSANNKEIITIIKILIKIITKIVIIVIINQFKTKGLAEPANQ